MKVRSAILAAVTGVALATSAQAAVLLSENFDGMGTGTTAPTGWSVSTAPVDKNTWSTVTNLNGVTLTVVTPLTVADAPTGNNNNGYNAIGVSGATSDRAIATAPTGNAGVVIKSPSITNTTGGSLTSFNISYDMKSYQAGAAGADELPGYQLHYSLDGGTTWNNVAALNQTNSSMPNTVGLTSIATTAVTLAGTWAAGSNMQLAWVDDNGAPSSPDQIIGLDNVVVSAAVPEPTTLSLIGLAALPLIRRRRA